MASAEAEAIKRIAAALPDGQVAMYLLGQKYLEMLPALAASKGSTVFLPAEAAGMMGALGGIRELLNRTSGGTNVEPPRSSPPSVPRLPSDFPPGFGS